MLSTAPTSTTESDQNQTPAAQDDANGPAPACDYCGAPFVPSRARRLTQRFCCTEHRRDFDRIVNRNIAQVRATLRESVRELLRAHRGAV